MDSNGPGHIDIESLLERLRPPSIPDEAFNPKNTDLDQITSWKREFTVAILAGLLTVPDFYANGIRLDWLLRLVLSKAEGQHEPESAEVSRALNAGLDGAGVLRLEDPIEDLFCDLIATETGCFRIFPGNWETAGPYTQTLLDAFETFPEHAFTRDALKCVYSLLKLSDAIAARANVHRDNVLIGGARGADARTGNSRFKAARSTGFLH